MKDNQFYMDPIYQKQFSTEISQFNIQRGKLLAAIVIGIELLLLVISLFSRFDHTRFEFGEYALMYILIVIATGLVWIVLSHFEHNLVGFINEKALNLTIITYITFIMTWGAVVSLLDQALYGNIVVFLVNMLLGSFLFYIKNTHIIIPQLIALLVLIIGLPYFQPSRDILIGHYINGSIFLVFVWLIAQTNYANYVKNFLNRMIIEEKSILLAQINNDLVLEIQSRKQAQQELETAHEQFGVVKISSVKKCKEFDNHILTSAL